MSHSLVENFGSILNGPPVAIEILPGNGDEWFSPDVKLHNRYLLVEGNLGVPQKVLCKAYLESVHLFRELRDLLRQSSPHICDTLSKQVLHTSAILVVLNPGHHTAWNTRKLLIRLGKQDAARELSFTSAMLTIRECAKQSLLWYHRRWLLRLLHPSHAVIAATSADEGDLLCNSTEDEDTLCSLDIPPDALEAEFAASTLACNTYERNYFAWSHRARCLDALGSAIHRFLAHHGSLPLRTWKVLKDERAHSLRWIEQHVSDYSAVQYQCRIDMVIQRCRGVHAEVPKPDGIDCTSFEHAWSMLQSYPDHESLWLYLRACEVTAAGHSGRQLFSSLEAAAKTYLGQNDQPVSVISSTASTEVQRQARRCLEWLERVGARLT